jgi:hypothetical protein
MLRFPLSIVEIDGAPAVIVLVAVMVAVLVAIEVIVLVEVAE